MSAGTSALKNVFRDFEFVVELRRDSNDVNDPQCKSKDLCVKEIIYPAYNDLSVEKIDGRHLSWQTFKEEIYTRFRQKVFERYSYSWFDDSGNDAAHSYPIIDSNETLGIALTRLWKDAQDQKRIGHRNVIYAWVVPKAKAQHSSSIASTIANKMMDRKPPLVVFPDYRILSQALTETPQGTLRNLLREMCRNIPAARDLALSRLTVFEDALLEQKNSRDDGGSDAGSGLEEYKWRSGEALSGRPWWKQRCVKYQTCCRCEKEFNLQHNFDAEACRWHDGIKVIDDEAEIWNSTEFPDFDYGEFEALVDDPRYASGFVWDCCDANVEYDDTDGCKSGRHVPMRPRAPILEMEELSNKRGADEVGDSRNVKRRTS